MKRQHKNKIYTIPISHGKQRLVTKDIAALHFLNNIPMASSYGVHGQDYSSMMMPTVRVIKSTKFHSFFKFNF